jgi:hypothetical protein
MRLAALLLKVSMEGRNENKSVFTVNGGRDKVKKIQGQIDPFLLEPERPQQHTRPAVGHTKETLEYRSSLNRRT